MNLTSKSLFISSWLATGFACGGRNRLHASSLDRTTAYCPAAACRSNHPSQLHQQLPAMHRFRRIIRGPGRQALGAILQHGPGLEGNDRHMGEMGIGANPPRGLITAQAGHPDIHEDDVEILFEQARQGPFAGAGGDLVGVEVAEHAAQGEQRAGVVVDQQDRRLRLVCGGSNAGPGDEHGKFRGPPTASVRAPWTCESGTNAA